MSTNYQRGAAFELRVKHHLEVNGYEVIRSAGSHSIIDLIALKPGQLLIIQCKASEKPALLPADRQRLTAFAAWLNNENAWVSSEPHPHDCLPLLACKTKTGGHIEYRHVTPADTAKQWTPDYA